MDSSETDGVDSGLYKQYGKITDSRPLQDVKIAKVKSKVKSKTKS